MNYDPQTLQLALTVLLGIWDRGAALLKSGKSSRERDFKEIVEPLYRELQPIGADYFELFVRTYQEVDKAKGKSFARPLASLIQRREVLRSARAAIRARAEELVGLSKDEALTNFLSSVVSFIESPQTVNMAVPKLNDATAPKKKPMSRSAELIDHLETLTSKKSSKNELLAYIGAAIQQMETSWASVGKTYAQVQARYLGTRNLR